MKQKEQETVSSSNAREEELSAQNEEMRKNLLAKDEELQRLQEAIRQNDEIKADAWFAREKALVLQLHDSAQPEDGRTFECLLQMFTKNHKMAMESAINLKDWCRQNKVNVIDRPSSKHPN